MSPFLLAIALVTRKTAVPVTGRQDSRRSIAYPKIGWLSIHW
ncbi:hypothetical protein [Oxynema sp. CENA135]|nr:hypothetical protein [Oxynema sp. CENA135]